MQTQLLQQFTQLQTCKSNFNQICEKCMNMTWGERLQHSKQEISSAAEVTTTAAVAQ
jgi:hypothetical protein